MRHWMMRCDDVSKKVSEGMDTPQPLGTRMLIRMHLWMCGHCNRVHSQLQRLRRASRMVDDTVDGPDCPPDLPTTLSPEARERIKARLGCGGDAPEG